MKTTKITFGEVISLSEKHINSFLHSVGIEKEIELLVNIHDNKEKYKFDIELTDRFEWKENEYAWFTIKGIAGGSDAYYELLAEPEIDINDPWWKLEELRENNKSIDDIEFKLEKAKKLNRIWYFRRSAGQAGIINVSYGIIGASVAELTSGILSSTDGAWDYRHFPAESKEFLDCYFRPEKAISDDYAEWAQACIDGIEEELLRPTRSKNKLWSKLKSLWT